MFILVRTWLGQVQQETKHVSWRSIYLPSKDAGADAQGLSWTQAVFILLLHCSYYVSVILRSANSSLQLQLHSCVVTRGREKEQSDRPHFREGVPQPSRFLPTFCLCDHSPSVTAPTKTVDFFVLFLEKQIIDNSWKIGRCYRHSHEAIMEHITDKEIQVVRGAGLPIVVNLCRHLSALDQAVW